MRNWLCALIVLIFCDFISAQSRQHTSLPGYTDSIPQITSKYFDEIAKRASSLDQKLNKHAEKSLNLLLKEERRLKRKLAKIDSLASNEIFQAAETGYAALQEKLQDAPFKQYIPRLDSLSTSLKFLQQDPQLLSQTKEMRKKLDEALSKVKGLEGQFQKAEEIKKFLKERKHYLKEQLDKFGLAKDLKKVNKQVYYYNQQVKQYKEIISDPKKVEKKALELLSRTKLFQEFFKKHSMLASLFRMPGDPDDPAYLASLAGLQTRAQVNSLVQQQITGGGPNAQQQLSQNLQAAQAELNKLKNKIRKAGTIHIVTISLNPSLTGCYWMSDLIL